MEHTVFDMKANDNKGKEISLEAFAGKVLIVVNTASKCGFTPQYKGLESLNKKYKEDGLVILGFPCDQFAHQEPGTDADIASFCEVNYGVTFPLMSKVNVNGKDTHPVFKLLKKQAPGTLGSSVKWNFTKFLVSRDGGTVKRFSPDTAPEKMEADIRKALGL